MRAQIQNGCVGLWTASNLCKVCCDHTCISSAHFTAFTGSLKLPPVWSSCRMVLSREAVTRISGASINCPSIDYPDDMYLGTVARQLEIDIVHSPLFHQVIVSIWQTHWATRKQKLICPPVPTSSTVVPARLLPPSHPPAADSCLLPPTPPTQPHGRLPAVPQRREWLFQTEDWTITLCYTILVDCNNHHGIYNGYIIYMNYLWCSVLLKSYTLSSFWTFSHSAGKPESDH